MKLETELDEIEFVAPCGMEETFDLEVEHSDHTFFANDISVSNSHAVAYAINSYQCAWLLTYYPDEWITTYIDYCATEKGKVSGKEDPKAVALSEAHALGYEIGKPDINYSERDYIIKDKKLIPSFSSLKHIGTSVLSEINEFRPYKTIEDLLFSKTIIGPQWRHSKLNKRAMATLVKLEAFESLGLVGEGKMFKNYRQLYYVLVEKGEELKKAVSKKKKTHLEELAQFIEEAKELPDFTLEEKVQFSVELSGTVDIGLIITPEVREYFRSQNIGSIDEWEDGDQDTWMWAIVKSATIAKTKNNKPYIRMRLYGESGNTQNCFCWNFNEKVDKPMPENSLILSRFKRSDFGFSTFWKGIDVITEK